MEIRNFISHLLFRKELKDKISIYMYNTNT